MYRSTSSSFLILLFVLVSLVGEGSSVGSYTAREVLAKRPSTTAGSEAMVPAVEFEVTREKKFPARALEPILHVGNLEIRVGRYVDSSNTTLIFTCFEPGKLENDVPVYVQYGDDRGSRTDFPRFYTGMINRR